MLSARSHLQTPLQTVGQSQKGMMKRKSVIIAISLASFFVIILLYKRISKPSLYTSRSKSTDLVFLRNPDILLDRNMSKTDVDAAFYKFLEIRHVVCQISKRYGKAGDGGWDMCLAEPYRPKQPCLVYSFGINNDFSFDDAISKDLGCTVRSFDPSMKVKDYQRSPSVWFYKIGIGGHNTINDEGWILKTLPDIVKSMNESDVIIDYLKMDVELSEWPSLTQMLSVGFLSKVKQLGIEVHVSGKNAPKSLFYMYGILKTLEDEGFRRWHSAMNFYHVKISEHGFRSCCYEMVYINTRFL